MPTNFVLKLDTTGPANPKITYGSYATTQLITVNISTTDGTTTGYQMKIWGSVDKTHNVSIQDTEVASGWLTFSPTQQVKLSTGDGNKTIYLKLRDDVLNESPQDSVVTILDTAKPIPNITVGPDVTKVSKQAGKDTVNLSFQSDSAIKAWKIKVVASASDTENMGVQIGTAFGSTNVTGGALAATTNQSVTIKAADVEAASSGDGDKIVKIFVQDDAGWWSV